MLKTKLRQLEVTQNMCLRAITGAYKSTPIAVLEHKAGCPPLAIQLKKQAAAYTERTRTGSTRKHIKTECNNTRAYITQHLKPTICILMQPTRRDKIKRMAAAITGPYNKPEDTSKATYRKQRRALISQNYKDK